LKNNIYKDSTLCAPPNLLYVCLLLTHEDSHENQTMTFSSTLSAMKMQRTVNFTKAHKYTIAATGKGWDGTY
jgi:hypothetical protein